MVNETQLVEVIKKAKESDKTRKFQQSIEMILVFKDIDVKKGFAISETIQLPKKMSKSASVCIIAAGDLGIKAKNCLLYTSPSPRDGLLSRMPSSA